MNEQDNIRTDGRMIQELLDAGFTFEECMKAIDLSNDDNNYQSQYLSKCLSDLLNIAEYERNKGIQLILKIFANILSYPTNPKYRDLHYDKVKKKLINCTPCFNLLSCAGFKQSVDQKRLKWFKSKQHLNALKNVNKRIMRYSTNTKSGDVNQPFIPHHYDKVNYIKSDSKYLLNSSIISSNNVEYKCDLSECICFKIICNVLQLNHKRMANNEEKMDGMFNQIGNNYNNVDLLNDFNHLASYHSAQFEDIYDILIKHIYDNKPCNLFNCLSMKRNQRDRAQITKQEHMLQEMYWSDDDIVTQQLLDRIHCYYFHSFDAGYKLTKDEKKMIINQETKSDDIDYDVNILQINEVIKRKQNKYKQIDGLNRLNNTNNKYRTNKQQELKAYSFGFRFYYWQYSKYDHIKWNYDVNPACSAFTTADDADQWFIDRKYENLKEELTNNEICRIGELQFNHLVKKAEIHGKTEKVKELFCPRTTSAKCYDTMYYGQTMSINHLISMMAYCNFDELQRKFSETFRKLDKNESNQSLKNRHSNYYFMARLLRECVECFGVKVPFSGCKYIIRIFHGMNESFTFLSMDTFIMGPFSTTTDYAVAVNFCQNKGLMLEMFIDAESWRFSMIETEETAKRISCMDMEWISDFRNEQEIFFIGGLHKIQYKTIINVLIGTNYMAYIDGLRQLVVNTSTYGDASQPNLKNQLLGLIENGSSNQMAFRLLSHELYQHIPSHKDAHPFKTMPKYIQNILHSHCLNVSGIRIGANDVIIDYFFKYKPNDWIKLNLLLMVFPNLKLIKYIAYNKDIKWFNQTSIWESILEFIAKNKNTSLEEIYMECNWKIDEMALKKCVDKYKINFFAYSWSIETATIDISNLHTGFISNMFSQLRNNPVEMKKVKQTPIIKKLRQLLGEGVFEEMVFNPDAFYKSSYILIQRLY